MKRLVTNRYAYIALVVALVVGANISLFMSVRREWPIEIAITVLFILFVLIMATNYGELWKKRNVKVMTLFLLGVLLTIMQDTLALVYGIAGLLLLFVTQMRNMVRGESKWMLVGGKPTQTLDAVEKGYAIYGLAILLSCVLTFIVKILWLAHSI